MDSTFKVSPFNVPFHGDFLRGVFVESRFMSFKRVHTLAGNERVLVSLLDASDYPANTQRDGTFRTVSVDVLAKGRGIPRARATAASDAAGN